MRGVWKCGEVISEGLYQSERWLDLKPQRWMVFWGWEMVTSIPLTSPSPLMMDNFLAVFGALLLKVVDQ